MDGILKNENHNIKLKEDELPIFGMTIFNESMALIFAHGEKDKILVYSLINFVTAPKPPKKPILPDWAVILIVAAIVVLEYIVIIGGCILYNKLSKRKEYNELEDENFKQFDSQKE